MKMKRSYTRFKADAGTLALIDIKKGEKFHPELVGLVFEEAYKGCGIIVLAAEELQIGQIIKVAVGKLKALKAEVCWRIQLDSNVIKIGIKYLE